MFGCIKKLCSIYYLNDIFLTMTIFVHFYVLFKKLKPVIGVENEMQKILTKILVVCIRCTIVVYTF